MALEEQNLPIGSLAWLAHCANLVRDIDESLGSGSIENRYNHI